MLFSGKKSTAEMNTGQSPKVVVATDVASRGLDLPFVTQQQKM